MDILKVILHLLKIQIQIRSVQRIIHTTFTLPTSLWTAGPLQIEVWLPISFDAVDATIILQSQTQFLHSTSISLGGSKAVIGALRSYLEQRSAK